MFLYRRLGLAVILLQVFFLASAVRAVGQGVPQLKRRAETPEEKPPEVKKPKKGKDPRAVGLLQLNSGGKATLIPIAILIDGKFHDASAYKANPVPMALESGTVYEAEQAGDSQGLFTVSGALHSKAAGSAHPWVGAGSYLPKGSEVATTTHKAEDVPVGLSESGDGPPRLTRGNGSKGTGSANTAPPGTSSSPSSGGSGESGSSDKAGVKTPGSADKTPSSDKPAIPSTAAGSSDKAGPPPSSDKGASAPHPVEQPKASVGPTSAGAGAAEQRSKDSGTPAQSQESQNYYRPTLRRGRPTQAAPEEDEASAKSVKPGSPTAGSPGTATGAGSAPVQWVPAISDAGGPDPRPFKFFWKEGEEEERRKQMLALAGDEVLAYGNARAKGMIVAKPPAGAKSGAPGRKAKVMPVEPVFENVQFCGFDVWVNNQPVMILSAEAHVPPAPGAATAPEAYSITLVARTDIYGNLRKLYSGVTDKFHLDVTPRLELIDAVDADGDGRGELLFRETSDGGSGFVIYRATADKLWKMFDSLEE